MRIIKGVFSTVALILLTTCSNNEILEGQTDENKEIQFVVSSLSRNPVNDVTELESFYVWAANMNNNTEFQFEQLKVERNDAGEWKSSSPQYWQTGTYNFYAVTGYKETEPSPVTANLDGNFVITVGDDETNLDLMTAVSSEISYSVVEGEPSPVAFHFYHEKAQIEISVKVGAQLPDATVTGITLSNFYKGGEFTRKFLDSSNRGSWDFTKVNKTSWEMNKSQTIENKTGGSYSFLSGFMIPAQSLGGVNLKFSYTISGASYSKEFELSQIGTTALEAGKINKYNFTIQPEGIVFDGFTVPDWGETNTGGNINIGTETNN